MDVARARVADGRMPVLKVASLVTISGVTGTGPSSMYKRSGTFDARTEIHLDAGSSFISESSRCVSARSAFRIMSDVAITANPVLTTVTCVIAELAMRNFAAMLSLTKSGDMRRQGCCGSSLKNNHWSSRGEAVFCCLMCEFFGACVAGCCCSCWTLGVTISFGAFLWATFCQTSFVFT